MQAVSTNMQASDRIIMQNKYTSGRIIMQASHAHFSSRSITTQPVTVGIDDLNTYTE